MTRGEITRKRAAMLCLVVVTVYLLSDSTQNLITNKITALLLLVGWIIAIVYWISGEQAWREEQVKKNLTVSYPTNSGKSVSKTIVTIAAICTILGTVLLFFKECN
ncbi:MAG: hypothetical protein COB85_02385 [Bacteroidetes bacterium]|nr:MAG: hypothetical protein COB85_02385 [Bacteroidota bacterium]